MVEMNWIRRGHVHGRVLLTLMHVLGARRRESGFSTPRPVAVVSLYGVYDWAVPGPRRLFRLLRTR